MRAQLIQMMLEASDKPGGKGPGTATRVDDPKKPITKKKFDAFKRLHRIRKMQGDREEAGIDDRNRKHRQKLGTTSMPTGKVSKPVDMPDPEEMEKFKGATPFEPQATTTPRDMPSSAGGLGMSGRTKAGQVLAPPDPLDTPVWAGTHSGTKRKTPKPPMYKGKFFGQAAVLGKQRQWKNTSWHEIKRDITSPTVHGRVAGWDDKNASVWVWDDSEWIPAKAFDIKYGKGAGSEFGEPKRADVKAKLQKDPHTQMPAFQPAMDPGSPKSKLTLKKPGADPRLSYDPSQSTLPKDAEDAKDRDEKDDEPDEKEKKSGLAAKPKLKMKKKIKKIEGVDESFVREMMENYRRN